MRAAILVMIFCLGFTGSVTAQAQPQPLTLAEAMLLALQHNPGLKAAGMTVETAGADLAKARARFLPTVNFVETYNFSDNPSQVFMSKLNQRVFTAQDFQLNNLNNPNAYGNFRTGLVLNQPLFQAGEAVLGYQQARPGREMAGAIVLNSRQQLLPSRSQAPAWERNWPQAPLGRPQMGRNPITGAKQSFAAREVPKQELGNQNKSNP